MLTNKKGTVLVVAVTAMMIMIIIGAVCLQIYMNQSLIDTYDQIRMRTFYSAEGAIELMRGYIDKQVEANLVTSGDTRGDCMYNNRGFLAYVTRFTGYGYNKTTEWEPFKENTSSPYAIPLLKDNFDGIIYPGIKARVYLRRITYGDLNDIYVDRMIRFKDATGAGIDGQIFNPVIVSEAMDNGTEYRGYEIVAIASTTYKTSISVTKVETTLRYYFYTRRISHDLGAGVTSFENRINWVGWRKD